MIATAFKCLYLCSNTEMPAHSNTSLKELQSGLSKDTVRACVLTARVEQRQQRGVHFADGHIRAWELRERRGELYLYTEKKSVTRQWSAAIKAGHYSPVVTCSPTTSARSRRFFTDPASLRGLTGKKSVTLYRIRPASACTRFQWPRKRWNDSYRQNAHCAKL